MKKLLLTTSVLLLIPVLAHAETKTYTEAEEQFHKADIIADGNIDAGEYDIYINQSYIDMDVDGDGFLTPDECLKDCFKEKHTTKGGVMQGQFETIDMDGNGYISNLNTYFSIVTGSKRLIQIRMVSSIRMNFAGLMNLCGPALIHNCLICIPILNFIPFLGEKV